MDTNSQDIKYVKTFEEINRLSMNRKDVVREWAMYHLHDLYPHMAGDTAAILLSDKNKDVALAAAYYFAKHPAEQYKSRLVDAYKTSSEMLSGVIATALSKIDEGLMIETFREKYASLSDDADTLKGYALSVLSIGTLKTDKSREITRESLSVMYKNQDHIYKISSILFSAYLVAGGDVKWLITYCNEHFQDIDIISRLFDAITQRFNVYYEFDDFIIEKKLFRNARITPNVIDSIDFINELGYEELSVQIERHLKKGRFLEVARKIYSATESLVGSLTDPLNQGDKRTKTSWGSGVPSDNIKTIDAIYQIINGLNAPYISASAIALIGIFSSLVENKDLIGINIETLNAEEALRLFLQDREKVDADDILMEKIRASGSKEWIIETSISALEEETESQAAVRIIELLKGYLNHDVALRLIRLPAYNLDLWDAIADALPSIGNETADIAEQIIKSGENDKIGFTTKMLANSPTDKSVKVILKHWDRLYRYDKLKFTSALIDIGDRRFIEPLGNILKDNEHEENQAFYMLCLINNVKDPRLNKVENYLNISKKKEERLIKQILENSKDIIYEPITLELRCRRCGNVYQYEIKKILINAENWEKRILDDVLCKNCKALNHYEITDKGELSFKTRFTLIMGLDDEEALTDEDATLSLFKGKTLSDGKEMSLEEGIKYYEQKIKDHPGNIQYLVGFANTLRHAKRTDDAVPLYHSVIAMDPNAIEAYVSLADIAEKSGQLQAAYEYLRQAVHIMPSANFYKLIIDREDFKKQVVDIYMYLTNRLGIKTTMPEIVDLPREGFSHPPSPVAKSHVGRNDPCPCGSGKKYKKCCLNNVQAQKSADLLHNQEITEEQRLISRIIKHSEGIAESEFLKAYNRYYCVAAAGSLAVSGGALAYDSHFIEWYVNNYILSSGRTIIEDFYTKNLDGLTPQERKNLEAHIQTYTSIYEVQDIKKDVGMTVKEIITNKELFVTEKMGTQSASIWDILSARVYTLDGINRFSGNVAILPRNSKDKLMVYLKQEFKNFKMETGKTEWHEFMKDRSYIIDQYVKRQREEKKRIATSEGHPLVIAKAQFKVNNFEMVVDLLSREIDFVENSIVPGRAEYTWIKRGVSKNWKVVSHKKTHQFKSQYVQPDTNLQFDVLGSILIERDMLTIECLSKERLSRGKERLTELLWQHIKHKSDAYSGIHGETKKTPEDSSHYKKDLSEEEEIIMQQTLKNYAIKWLDKPLTGLNGMTPREAASNDRSRKKLIELFKDIENIEQRNRLEGNHFVDTEYLKKELGL